MTKQGIRLLIPLIITGCLLVYCWIILISTDIVATWRHYAGLGLFLLLILLFLKSYKSALIGSAVYFLLGTFNVLSVTADISVSWFKIGPVETIPVSLLLLSLFILFAILNMDSFIDMYLDYKERKQGIEKSN